MPQECKNIFVDRSGLAGAANLHALILGAEDDTSVTAFFLNCSKDRRAGHINASVEDGLRFSPCNSWQKLHLAARFPKYVSDICE